MSAANSEERRTSPPSREVPSAARQAKGRQGSNPAYSKRGPALRRDQDNPADQRPQQRVVPPASRPAVAERADPRQVTTLRRHAAASPTERVQEQERTSRVAAFFDRRPLEKSFVYFGFVVAITMVLLFGSDLVAGWPFRRAGVSFDVIVVACGLLLGYLSWDTHKDLR